VLLTGFIFLDLNEGFLNYYLIIADAMYLPSMYDDLIVHGNTFTGWNVNPAPNFFPDIPLYFLLNALFGNFQNATAAYALVQTAITSLLLLALLQRINAAKGYYYATLANICLMLLPFVHFIDNEYIFSLQLIVNSFHHSALLNGLACLIYAFSYLNSKNKWWLMAIFLHGSIGIISDKLVLVTFIVPAFVMCIVAIAKHKKHALFLLSCVLLTLISGLVIFNQLKTSNLITIPAPHKFLAYDNIIVSIEMITKQLKNYFSIKLVLGWMLTITLAAFLILSFFSFQKLSHFFKPSKAKNITNENFFHVFVAVFMVVVLIAPVLNGSYTGYDTIRYNYFTYIIGVAVFPYALIKLMKIGDWKLLFTSRIMVGLGVVVITFSTFFMDLNDYSYYKDFYPNRVRELDEIAEQKNLHYGVAPYGDSKIITLFSKQNLRVYTVFEDLSPWMHVSNPNWYYTRIDDHTRRAKFEFVVTNSETAERLTNEKVGPIKESISLPSFKVQITPAFGYSAGSYQPSLLGGKE
jgi:hypothetical protein